MDLFLYLDRDVEETRGTATESPMGAGNDGGQTERDGKSKEEVRIWVSFACKHLTSAVVRVLSHLLCDFEVLRLFHVSCPSTVLLTFV